MSSIMRDVRIATFYSPHMMGDVIVERLHWIAVESGVDVEECCDCDWFGLDDFMEAFGVV